MIPNNLKTIKVVAAIIIRDNQILATQRGYGDYKGWWEFPGGKIEQGETPQEALRREILEELDARIIVGELLQNIEYTYPTFHLSMQCFVCSLESESIHLNEHDSAKWLDKDCLYSVKWLPADIEILPHINRILEIEG